LQQLDSFDSYSACGLLALWDPVLYYFYLVNPHFVFISLTLLGNNAALYLCVLTVALFIPPISQDHFSL